MGQNSFFVDNGWKKCEIAQDSYSWDVCRIEMWHDILLVESKSSAERSMFCLPEVSSSRRNILGLQDKFKLLERELPTSSWALACPRGLIWIWKVLLLRTTWPTQRDIYMPILGRVTSSHFTFKPMTAHSKHTFRLQQIACLLHWKTWHRPPLDNSLAPVLEARLSAIVCVRIILTTKTCKMRINRNGNNERIDLSCFQGTTSETLTQHLHGNWQVKKIESFYYMNMFVHVRICLNGCLYFLRYF